MPPSPRRSRPPGRTAGTLRINTLGMAAKKIIAPRLGRFHRAHPDVVLDIVIDDGLSDIVAGRFDAGIRVGERLEKDMIAVRLTPDVKMLAVASPDYLARRGEPKTPADLHRHACINWRFPGSGRIYRWEFEKKGQEARDGRGRAVDLESPGCRRRRRHCRDSAFSMPTTTIASTRRSRADGSSASWLTGH